jgi:hypothetical protein
MVSGQMTRGAVISMALLAIIVVALLVWVRRKFPSAISSIRPVGVPQRIENRQRFDTLL